jgi:predicted RNA-binding Zn ribbon-like protein
MPRYDLPNAAPEPLRLVQLFANSIDREHGTDWIGTSTELRGWLRRHELPSRGVDAALVAHAHALRDALWALLRANAGARLPRAAVREVNRCTVDVRLDADGEVELTAGGTALDRIVAVAFGAMLDGSWVRLKACPRCGWAFYDKSKNRSASWCSMQLCGNRVKTRAYRRRKEGR